METVKTKTGMLGSLPIKRREGFTLIEILVAIVLIATGILGFSINTIGVIRGNYISLNVTIATNLAQDKMEELLGRGTLSNVTDFPDPPNSITETGATGGRFDRTWTVSDSALGAGLKDVTVWVRWSDYIDREVTLSTLVYKP